MKQQTTISTDATVIEDRSNSMFLCELDNGHQVLCTISGKMRIKNVRVMPGDRVAIELDIYSMQRGRIVYRRQPDGTPQNLSGSRDTKPKKQKGNKKK